MSQKEVAFCWFNHKKGDKVKIFFVTNFSYNLVHIPGDFTIRTKCLVVAIKFVILWSENLYNVTPYTKFYWKIYIYILIHCTTHHAFDIWHCVFSTTLAMQNLPDHWSQENVIKMTEFYLLWPATEQQLL